MLTVERIEENNKQRLLSCLELDIIRHVFAFYDLQHEPEHTTTYAVFDNNSLKGYLLNYTGSDVPSTILESDNIAAEKLIAYAPEDHFVIHAPPDLLPVIKERFPTAKHYAENWMLARKSETTFFKSDLVRQYVEWLKRMKIYGVFFEGGLVSYSGSFLQMPEIWMIGGVYTHPDQRSKGYSTLATSAITEEALRNAEAAALFVRSDNYPAIRVYEKIGYKKIGEKIWVDIGTDIRP